jgi:hypothetical protein
VGGWQVVLVARQVLFVDHRDQTRLVDRSGVAESGRHPVTHLTVERAFGKVLSANLPVLRLAFDALDHRETVFEHQLVVGGLHATLVAGLAVVKRPIVRKGFARNFVVVDDQAVVVGLASATIGVRNNQSVRVRMHLLRQQVSEVVDALHICGARRVELVVAE